MSISQCIRHRYCKISFFSLYIERFAHSEPYGWTFIIFRPETARDPEVISDAQEIGST